MNYYEGEYTTDEMGKVGEFPHPKEISAIITWSNKFLGSKVTRHPLKYTEPHLSGSTMKRLSERRKEKLEQIQSYCKAISKNDPTVKPYMDALIEIAKENETRS